MNIRKADFNDIEKLTELRIAQLNDEGERETEDSRICRKAARRDFSCLSQSDNSHSIKKALKDYFCDALKNGSAEMFVGEINGQIVTTAAVCYYVLPPSFKNPDGKTAYGTNIYTLPAFRGNGYAKEVVGYMLERVKEKGYKSVRLHATKMGRGLYEKLGFTDDPDFMIKEI